jgi:23S rRNA-/tRNA-specific pseudouridylate synthase
LDVVYEDESLLVVNKKAGMVVHPAHGTIQELWFMLWRGDIESWICFSRRTVEPVGSPD